MTQIQPFNPDDPEIKSNIEYIMQMAPVKNLTEDEVVATLRLLYLHVQLATNKYGEVVIHRNDARLELCSDEDRFLAMLVDCDMRDVLLFSGRCRSLFGGSVYHWRKIARGCAITSVASAISECGAGYYGRGWEIAPHICTLRRWIVARSNNPEYDKLKDLRL